MEGLKSVSVKSKGKSEYILQTALPQMSTPLIVPETVTFEQAIALTQALISQAETGFTQPEIAAVIADLVKTENGARGFFVTYLTSDTSLADHPSDEVVQALQTSPEVVAELSVKNLAMSAAQALYHRRNQNEEMALSSDRVRQRTAHLIKLVNLPAVDQRMQQLLETVTTGEGSYKAFLERWGYDTEQRQVMRQALQQVMSN